MKVVSHHLSPFALTAVRGLMGGALLAAWLLVSRQNIWPRKREWRDWMALGFLQGIVPNTLTAFALSQIAAGLTSMIQASTPLLVAVLAHFLFDEERLTAPRLMGVLTGFLGMVILIGPALNGRLGGGLLGVLAMSGAAISYAIGSVYVRCIPAPQPIRLALGQQAFSGIPMFAIVLLFSGPSAFSGISEVPVKLIALGVFGTALPIVLYMYILKRAGPTLGSMNGYFLPPWTCALGYLCLHEQIVLREIVATLIIFAGIAVVSAFSTKRTKGSATDFRLARTDSAASRLKLCPAELND